MATIVQNEWAYFSDSTETRTISFQNPTQAGNSIVFVAVLANGLGGPFVVPTDTQGLTFNKVAPDLSFTEIISCCLATGTQAASDTISFNVPNPAPFDVDAFVYIFEVEGTLVFDTSASNTSYNPGGVTSFSSGAITPQTGYFEAGAFAFGGIVSNGVNILTPFLYGEFVYNDGGDPIFNIAANANDDETQFVFQPTLDGFPRQMTTPAEAAIWAFALPFISGNAGAGGATISYTGTSSGSVTADGSGNFTISGLAPGTYTISPARTGFQFSPSSQIVTVSNANITGVNFTATQVQQPSSRFTFFQRHNLPGYTLYDVQDGASTNDLGRTIAGSGSLVGQLFFDNIVAQAWSFSLKKGMPFIAAGSVDAEDIESFALSLPAPPGVTIVQPGPTPSTRFAFTAIVRRSGQTPLIYLVSDGPSQAYGSIGTVVWDGVFDRWTFVQTNQETEITSPADVACLVTFAQSLALISPNQISL